MTRLKSKLYDKFELEKLECDFMGYSFDNKKELTYHHIIPKNYGGQTSYENGALLIRDSHNYIHTIQDFEFKLFIELSYELKKEHEQGSITKENLIAIKQMLEYFESKYGDYYNKHGVPIIKENFVRGRVDLDGKS